MNRAYGDHAHTINPGIVNRTSDDHRHTSSSLLSRFHLLQTQPHELRGWVRCQFYIWLLKKYWVNFLLKLSYSVFWSQVLPSPTPLRSTLFLYTPTLCHFLKDVWPSARVWTMPLAAIHWQELLSKERDILPTSCSVLGFCLAWASPDLCTLLWPLWVLMCCWSIICGKHWLLVVAHHLWLLHPSHLLFHDEPWAPRGAVWYACWAFHSLFFSIPWPVVGLCDNSIFYRKRPLWCGVERCTYLWV